MGLSIVTNGIICVKGGDAVLPKFLWGGLVTVALLLELFVFFPAMTDK